MVIQFINLKELLESLILVTNLIKIIKRYKRVGYNMDIMHARIQEFSSGGSRSDNFFFSPQLILQKSNG